MELTKNQIKITKGIAILFMLLLHLFCTKKYEDIYKEIQCYEQNRKGESNFGRQMEWHVKIKKAEKKLESIKQKMKELC